MGRRSAAPLPKSSQGGVALSLPAALQDDALPAFNSQGTCATNYDALFRFGLFPLYGIRAQRLCYRASR